MIIPFELYGGKIKLLFDNDPKQHKYYIELNSEIKREVRSVTKITGIVDKSGPISWWAVNDITVPFIFGNEGKDTKPGKLKFPGMIKPGIAYDEVQLMEIEKEASKKFREKKEGAADFGTMAHAWVESWIKGENPAPPINDRLHNAVEAFLKWQEEYRVKFHISEKKVYAIKKDKKKILYEYAGTLDAEGEVNDKLSIIDFKSSNGIYEEMAYQTAAYQNARQLETKNKYYSRWIVRFGKEDAEFEAREYRNFKGDFEAFLGAYAIVKRNEELKAEIKK